MNYIHIALDDARFLCLVGVTLVLFSFLNLLNDSCYSLEPILVCNYSIPLHRYDGS